MVLDHRQLVLAVLACLPFVSYWFPTLRLLSLAFSSGALATFILVTVVLLATTRSVETDHPDQATSTFLNITSATNWIDEKISLSRRNHHSHDNTFGLPRAVYTSIDSVVWLALHDYVESWFDKISAGTSFASEVHDCIFTAFAGLHRLVAERDICAIVITRLLPIVNDHVEDFVTAEKSVRGRDSSGYHQKNDEFDIAIAAKYRDGNLHPAAPLAVSMTKAPQQSHLRRIVENILPVVLTDRLKSSSAVRVLIRELLACAILLPTLQLLSDPDFLHQQIGIHGRSVLHDQKTVRKLRAALDAHASPPAKTKRNGPMAPEKSDPGEFERSFGRLVRYVKDCGSATDLQRLRAEIVRQTRFESQSSAANLAFLRQLEALKSMLDRKLYKLTGLQKYNGSQATALDPRKLSKNQDLSLRDVLHDTQGLSYFIEYMDRLDLVSCVEFWIAVDVFRSSIESDEVQGAPRVISGDARQHVLARLGEVYFWNPELRISVTAQRAMQSFLRAGKRPPLAQYEAARNHLLDSQARLFSDMSRKHYPAFKRSELYTQLLIEPGRGDIHGEVTSYPPASQIKRERLPASTTRGSPRNASTYTELRRAAASSSDIVPDASEPVSESVVRRSMDDEAIRKPLFAEDEHAISKYTSSATTESGTDNQLRKNNNASRSESMDAVQAALNHIVHEDSANAANLIQSSAFLQEEESERSSLDDIRGTTRSPSPDKGKPSLASLGLVGAPSRQTVFSHDDLFGEDENLWEDDVVGSHDAEVQAEIEIREAAPGDLGLAEVIHNLSIDIDKLESQRAVVDSLTAKAELINNAAELRILRKSKVSLNKEIQRMEMQRQQYIVQESDNSLYGKANVSIKSIVVGTEPDGHEFALYIIEVFRQGDDQAPAASWAIARRYSEFHMLHRRLRARFASIRDMEFPRRQMVLTLQNDFLKKRRASLEKYMQGLLNWPEICRSLELRAFLSQQAITPVHGGFPAQIDRQDFVSRIYNSVTDGMEEFFGDVTALQQLSLAGQNLISAATSVTSSGPQGRPTRDNKNDGLSAVAADANLMPAGIANDPTTVEEAQAEITALEEGAATSAPETSSHRTRLPRTFIAPIATAFLTLFQLNKGNAWWRGRAVVVVLQQLLGGTIERKIRDGCRSLFLSAGSLAKNIDLVRESVWPNGVPRTTTTTTTTPPPARTVKERERSRREAEMILVAVMEETAGTVVGRSAAKEAGARMSRLIGNERLNAHLAFSLLDEFVDAVFGEKNRGKS